MRDGKQPEPIRVTATGEELIDLLAPRGGARRLIGISGSPGAGKSSFASFVVSRLGARAAQVPMDGFHLADVELVRQGLLGSKGAPETFDAGGYAALLGRLGSRPTRTVYAPAFDRELEQPLAGAIAVPPAVDVVVTEGNYLLLDGEEWQEARACLDEVWHVRVDETLRLRRLVARHIRYGKTPEAARSWVSRIDDPNARVVEGSAWRADRVLDLTRWSWCRSDRRTGT